MINVKMQPNEVTKLSPKIAVIGVGGAGGNAVNNMISAGLEGCDFLVCNTDAQALDNSLSSDKIQLGANVTGGLGAGSKPEIGKAAAEESLDEVMQHLDGANMAFVTAGMGGGTGTGAAPVIAKACRERGILTVGVVTKPFHFEGTHRMNMADEGLKELQEYVDTLIVIPNQNLFRIANEKTTFAEAFEMADSVLQAGVRGVTDLMVRPGLVNLDFADIRTAMLEMGKAMMGTGEAEGDKRAIEAAESAINNPLLDDVSMKGAHGVIINVTGGYDMTLFEADEACNRIRDEVDPSANIIFGATFDDKLEGRMRVSIVATGIEKEALAATRNGGGSIKVDATSSKTLERAQPQTGAQGGSSTSAAPSSLLASRPERAQEISAAAALSGAEALKTISAPPVARKSEEPVKMVQPENDMFEQGEFSTRPAQEKSELAENTAMRGTLYKDSFIPPKPVQVSDEEKMTGSMPLSSYHGGGAVAAAPIATQTSSGLQLNPPKMPGAPASINQEGEEAGKSPSLFERITGSVQQGIEGILYGQEEEAQVSAPESGSVSTGISAPKYSISSTPPPSAPSQGSLNIDSPSAKPSKAESDLDIPAFLRRQAN